MYYSLETDLHKVIKRKHILQDPHKRFIMYQLLRATYYIHSGNVIHRDQKVPNFFSGRGDNWGRKSIIIFNQSFC